MRAGIWTGPGSMELGEVGEPACPPDGALLRVVACGICGTDVRVFYNGDRRIEAPWILGHEISGEIVAVGPEAGRDTEHRVGDLVHLISTLYCGRCRLCRGGNEHLCLEGKLMGLDFPGAYAELVAVPNIALKNLFAVPDGLSPEHATFADPLSDAICGHKDLGIGLDDVVVVIGAGPIGTAHASLARAQGAGAVLLLEASPARLDLSRAVLGDERMRYVDVSGEDGIAAVRAATGGRGADRVIVACSNVQAQQDAMEMAAPRGRVLFFGGLPKGTTHIEFPSNVLHYQEVAVLGSYASRWRDQVQALDMLARNEGNVRAIVSETIPLEDAPGAFERIRRGEVLKVVVRP
jgi:L-iditol 2-dehydrogenase